MLYLCWGTNRTEGEESSGATALSLTQPLTTQPQCLLLSRLRKSDTFLMQGPNFHWEMFVEWLIHLACREEYLFNNQLWFMWGWPYFGKVHTFHCCSRVDWMRLNAGCVGCFFFCIVTHWIQEADADGASHSVYLNALLWDSAHSSTRLCLVASGASHWDNMLHN